MPELINLEEFDLPGMKTHQGELDTNMKNLTKLHGEIKLQVENFKNDSITTAELEERLGKINLTLTDLATKIETAQNANVIEDSRYIYNDYRSMIEGVDWLTKDDGTSYNDIEKRAHCLFQLEVSYDNIENGAQLKNLRNLHDCCYIVDRIHTYRASQGGRRYRIEDLPLFKSLVKHTERFDKEIAHAMAGGNTGYGAEWLPLEMSNEFNEILRILPSLANRFQTWNMPKGASGKFPFQNGKAVAYKGSEALVANAARARETDVPTAVHTFTPELFIAALVSSEEVTEDSIIAMLDFIRKELAMAINEGLETALINGDTGVHQDTAAKYPAYVLETAFVGLRAMAVNDGNTFDHEVPSGDTGVGGLATDAFLHALSVLGLNGVNPNDIFWLTGIKGKIEIMKALLKEDALGMLAFIINGKLPTIFGSDVHCSGQYLEQLETDGLYDASAQKHTSILGVHPGSFRIGQRRGVTLESAKDVMTQQIQIVATARYDFGRVSASSEAPVVALHNVQHTA